LMWRAGFLSVVAWQVVVSQLWNSYLHTIHCQATTLRNPARHINRTLYHML
jgi:hypothetical protein